MERVIIDEEMWVYDYDDVKTQASVNAFPNVSFAYNDIGVHHELLAEGRMFNKENISLKLCAICQQQYEQNDWNCETIGQG